MQESVESGLSEPVSLHPVFDPNRCIGSSACVTVCPESAIGIIHGKAQLVNPSSCIGHGACVASCPFDAITLEHEYELSEYDRGALIYTKDMLLAEHPKKVPLREEVPGG